MGENFELSNKYDNLGQAAYNMHMRKKTNSMKIRSKRRENQRMKQVTLFVSMLFLVFNIIAPAAAQPDPCDRDVIVATFGAAVIAGDVDAWAADYTASDCPAPVKEGVQLLVEAYEMLGADAVPSNGDVSLEASYTTEAGYTIRYPAGWLVQSQGQNTVFFANSNAVLQMADRGPSGLAPGERLVFFSWDDVEGLLPDANAATIETPLQLLNALIGDAVDPEFRFEAPFETDLADQMAAAARGVAFGNEFIVLVFKLDSSLYGTLLGLTLTGELESAEPVFRAMAASVLDGGEASAVEEPTEPAEQPTEIEMLEPVAVDPASWQLSDVIPLEDSFEGSYKPVLSPDGTSIAWWDRARHAVCVYDFDRPDPFCTTDTDQHLGSIHYLTWSADSAYVALTPNYFQFLHEPDIWLYEPTTGLLQNLTDDGIEDDPLRESSALIDYIPTWNPATGDIYFFRSRTTGDDQRLMELYRMSPLDGAPELVADLTDTLPEASVYRKPAVSPDGSQMALLVQSHKFEEPVNGVWLLDLEDGSLEQLVTYNNIASAGLPAWYENHGPMLESIAWTAGGTGLVISAIDLRYRASHGAPVFYYIDANTGELNPLFDFSDVPSQESFFEEDESGRTYIYRVPRWGILAPDGGTLFTVHHERTEEIEADIWAQPLPPDGSEPVVIGTFNFEIRGTRGDPEFLVEAGANGSALLIYHYLLSFEAE